MQGKARRLQEGAVAEAPSSGGSKSLVNNLKSMLTKPKEKAPAVTARSQPNSESIGGKISENAVRAFTPIPMVTKVTATTIQP